MIIKIRICRGHAARTVHTLFSAGPPLLIWTTAAIHGADCSYIAAFLSLSRCTALLLHVVDDGESPISILTKIAFYTVLVASTSQHRSS
ncbi:hypothetical protein Zmor_006401 [Zophobas morio]|uniref:Uncharacterized protein n=1 Tax=Zophobas morio TaxID=2755281 RepID=A0AA38MN28_9CUCU|nr:hypothetical protein Zmor_006401 [Zophobas morio]